MTEAENSWKNCVLKNSRCTVHQTKDSCLAFHHFEYLPTVRKNKAEQKSIVLYYLSDKSNHMKIHDKTRSVVKGKNLAIVLCISLVEKLCKSQGTECLHVCVLCRYMHNNQLTELPQGLFQNLQKLEELWVFLANFWSVLQMFNSLCVKVLLNVGSVGYIR